MIFEFHTISSYFQFGMREGHHSLTGRSIEDIGIPDSFGHAYSLDLYTFSNLLTQEGIEDIGIPDTFGHAYTLDLYTFSTYLLRKV